MITLQTQDPQEPYKEKFSQSQASTAKVLSPKTMTTKSVRSKQQKLITNITGKASDKLKLTKRLNEAVDDLIKMGQRYREKSQLIAS